MKSYSRWTPSEDSILKTLYPDTPTAEIAARLKRPIGSVYQRAAALGVGKSEAYFSSDASGRMRDGLQHPSMVSTRFQPGLTPWNKGTHFVAGGRSVETQFKAGQRPQTWRPVGSYRISSDGQLERKVNELPGANHVRWHSVARLVWEAENGPVPPGHVVVFRPGQRTIVLEEITIDRVECISRAELARRNHPRNISPELAKLVQLKGAITRQVNRISKESRETK